MICPKCGGVCDRDEVDVGIGTVNGPWFCPECHWDQNEEGKELMSLFKDHVNDENEKKSS